MMNDSLALLRTIGGFSSSVDPKPDDPRYVKEYMAKHQHPPFPVSWRSFNKRGQTLDAYLASLKHFYTISNGMEILYVEVCKCVIYTVIPSDLVVLDMEDEIFDTKAFRKGVDCTLTDDQKEGLNGRDMDTVTGLLLKTMSECYFKKRETIDKIVEIQRMQKRFSEFSSADIAEIEKSLEKRNDELSPAFHNCLSKLDENELHGGYEKLYIETWKLLALFSENESQQIQKMEEISQKYWESFKASEDKNIIIKRELKKLREKCSSLESKITEQKESISRLKKDVDSHRKQNEQSQKKLKEHESNIADLLRENKSYAQKNFAIQESRMEMETTLSKLKEEHRKLKSNYDHALNGESQYKTKVKNMESEIMLLEDEKASMKSEIDQTKAKHENLLTRLSEVAGAKLTHENTEITDLSDPNRPTKLGERFKEMYDNEWTEALEELTESRCGVKDKAALGFLLDVMMKSFRFCSETLDKQTSNCLRCFEEFPGPDSEDLKADDSVPPLRIDLEENMKEDINCMRRNVLKKMYKRARERYLANIEIHLQRALNQGSDSMSKSSENSMQTGTGTNGEAFTETDSPKLEGKGATNNLQENERSGECWRHEASGQNEEPMDVDQENKASQVQGDNDVVIPNNLKNEKEDIVNVSEACENQQGTSNNNRSTGVKDESNIGTQGDVSSNQTQNAGDVQTVSSGNEHAVQTENSQMGDESAPQDRNADEESMKNSFSKVYRYSYNSFNLCWLMRNHSPGLHLDDQVKQGSEFDVNRFRHYTQTGKHVDFLVWPALYLHKEGPLIAKGVAQPIKGTINRIRNNVTGKPCEENN